MTNEQWWNPLCWEYEHLVSLFLILYLMKISFQMARKGIHNTPIIVKYGCADQISHNNEHITLSLVVLITCVPLFVLYLLQTLGLYNGTILIHLSTIFESGLLFCLVWSIKHIFSEEDPTSMFYAYSDDSTILDRRKERREVKKDRRTGDDRRNVS